MRKLLASKLSGSSGASVRKPKERPVLVAGLTTDGKARVEADDPRGGNFCNQAYLYMVRDIQTSYSFNPSLLAVI